MFIHGIFHECDALNLDQGEQIIGLLIIPQLISELSWAVVNFDTSSLQWN